MDTGLVVWEYALKFGGKTTPIPADGKVVHVAKQETFAYAWVQHAVSAGKAVSIARKELVIRATGELFAFGSADKHVGTFFEGLDGDGTGRIGVLVWHVYELVK